MATKLMQVVEWTRPFTSNLFLFVDSAIGSSLEPALSNANLILGIMLGPPFVWEWNRNTCTFNCVITTPTTDYEKAVSDFGFLESGYIQVPANAQNDAGINYHLQPQRIPPLEASTQLGRPTAVTVFLDDGNGNITFRVGPNAPDLTYTVVLTYQKSPNFLTSAETTIEVPDKLMHIFRLGFLALAYLYNMDTRFDDINQRFIASLLATQEGLDESQRNIFIGNWYALLANQTAAVMKAQQATQARGSQ
jgi:hypothetical protein